MKVLIWDKHIELKDIGGPFGYLYKLHEYLKQVPSESISFYSDERINNEVKDIKDAGLSRFVVFKKSKFIFFLYTLYKTYFKELQLTDNDKSILCHFDIVHLHTMPEALQYGKAFHSLNIQIVLTTHTPEPFTTECFNNSGYSWMLRYVPFLKRILIKRELKAYDIVDNIMFPVPQAKEAYTSVSKQFANFFAKVEPKFFYVPTAINRDIFPTNEHLLDNVVCSTSSLKVCYIGRHNYIKGYDTIREIAKQVWAYNEDVEFIIGGKEGPLYGVRDKRWHELGWVSTYNLLEEIDVFILPNKQTYYDLILLEVIRSGIPIVLTETGGNCWFMQYPNTGLFFYNYGDITKACGHLLHLAELKKRGVIAHYGMLNSELFVKTSTFDIYVNSYLAALNCI